jgi:hypothetical protein
MRAPSTGPPIFTIIIASGSFYIRDYDTLSFLGHLGIIMLHETMHICVVYFCSQCISFTVLAHGCKVYFAYICVTEMTEYRCSSSVAPYDESRLQALLNVLEVAYNHGNLRSRKIISYSSKSIKLL